jgi:myo-inositol catabolism protein IolS
VEYINLSKSDLKVSRICFGGEQLGGFALGKYNVNDTITTARFAIDKGINFFDTADCYNLGKSEENLAKATLGVSREKLILSTKFGVRLNNNSNNSNRVFHDNTSKWLDIALSNSLRRLKTDYIDLYQIHYWDKVTPLEETFKQLERKCEKGIIRYYGVSNMGVLSKYVKDFPNLISFSNEISLVNRTHDTNIISNNKRGLSLLAFGVLGQGVLSGKYTQESIFGKNDRRGSKKYINFHGDKFEENIKLIKEIEKSIIGQRNITMSQIAINWILEKYEHSVVIAGMKNNIQLDDNLNVFNWKLTLKENQLLNSLL